MPRSINLISAVLGAALLLVSSTPTAWAHSGDEQVEQALYWACGEAWHPVGSADAGQPIRTIVAAAPSLLNHAGQPMLPQGTVVDAVRWAGHVVEIDLTVPAAGAADWTPSELEIESISDALGRPFAHDPLFGGVRVMARVGVDGTYDSLGQFLPAPPASYLASQQAGPREVLPPMPQYEQAGGAMTNGLGGPVAQAGRQPTGALSGVVVFASAGHGWTAGSSNWYLQRPVLWDMNEDYGNIDQLNYFVHYAFNAGATVVPFRPVGWQPIEIVLDNDDAGVTFTGSWTNGDSPKYYEDGDVLSGVVYKWTESNPTETATARYTPTITQTDFYPVYCFTIASHNRTVQTYRVSHSGGITEIPIDHRLVGNGWIWLGNYHLEAGGDNYVEITNASPEAGAIIADAIRWGGGFGDISRPGPGSTSGYPRDEECQRYFAQSELGNRAVGFDSWIWDIEGLDDGSDNVRTGAKWAAEMNQEPADLMQDRWKRVHLEFHTNAVNQSARGQITLITTISPTTYQENYAEILADEVDNDLLVVDEEFEHAWYDRPYPTYTSAYGAISGEANGNEFDATIVELAFHDNPTDAELLRDARVRAVMARACVHGIIRFLNTLPDSEVPLNFAPDTPRYVRAEDLGGGDVRISWQPPLSDDARGDPATGYVVYQSDNGYGFGSPIVLGNVLSTTISNVPTGKTCYYRVAATNAGGESMPSEVLAVRRAPAGTKSVLIVNGFDRQRRFINPIQEFDHPASYAGDEIDRVIWRRSNSYDYVVQHAEALAAAGYGFSTSSNDAIEYSYVQLGDYDIAVWICGQESTEDATLSSNEQNKLTDFLLDGGALFLSGSEIAYDLINQGHGVGFMQNQLQTLYVADDAGTYDVTAVTGSVMDGVAPFDFDPANGAAYDTRTPDKLAPGSDANACLNYAGGAGTAGVQYTSCGYAVVVFGFPFEAISTAAARDEVMAHVMTYLSEERERRNFDYDRDCDVDINDLYNLLFCFNGPEAYFTPGNNCVDVEGETDLDIDLEDLGLLQVDFTGPLD